MPEKPLLILVDMDGTITDFESPLLAAWQTKYPGRPFVPLEERRTHKVRDDYPPELREDLVAIYSEPGFFENLLPTNGAIAALHSLDGMGHQIFICTAPLEDYRNSLEKVTWVKNNLGPEWVRRMIITRDKTLIHGDIFIDDAPEFDGIVKPSWEHILFDQPYNRHITDRRRLDWQNYHQVLGI